MIAIVDEVALLPDSIDALDTSCDRWRPGEGSIYKTHTAGRKHMERYNISGYLNWLLP
jgi:hypothetical protein